MEFPLRVSIIIHYNYVHVCMCFVLGSWALPGGLRTLRQCLS